MNEQTDCISNFASRLLTDLGVGFLEKLAIGAKLDNALTIFEKNQSPTSLNEIAKTLYDCIKPHLDNSATITAEGLGLLVVYFSILTAITAIIIVIIIITLKNSNKNATIGLVILIAVFYIIIGWLLSVHTLNTITNSIVDSENKIIECVNTALTSLENMIQQDENAIQKALCVY